MSVTLGTLKDTIRNVSDDTALRFKSDGSITTASRGLGGRIVRWFNGGLDRRDNREMGGTLMHALVAEHGPEIAAAAFRMARGDTRTAVDGSVMIRASKPITARQVRNAIDFARSMGTMEARRAQHAPALLFVPENVSGFAQAAARAGVDPATLTAEQKDFYKARLGERVMTGAFEEGRPLSPGEAERVAAKALRYVAGLNPDQLHAARQQITGAETAARTLIFGMGGMGGSLVRRGAGEEARDPALALLSFLNKSDAALVPATLGGVAQVGGQDLTTVRMQVLDQVVGKLSPAAAKHLYEASMAPGGAARTLSFALGVAESEKPSGRLRGQEADRQAFKRNAAADMQGQFAFVMKALAQRAGLPDDAVDKDLRVIETAIRKMDRQEASTGKPSSKTLDAAGVSGNVGSALAQVRKAVEQRVATLKDNMQEGGDQGLENMLHELHDHVTKPEVFAKMATHAELDAEQLDGNTREQFGVLVADSLRTLAAGGSPTERIAERLGADLLRRMNEGAVTPETARSVAADLLDRLREEAAAADV